MNTEQLLAHYERIADAPDAVPRLRQFILDLAVRGKLVPQDASDEPAAELLKRIAAEKARLVKAGEIKKEKESSKIHSTELPFTAPENWAWLRLRDVGLISGGMTPSMSRSDYWGGSIVWLSPKDIKMDEVSESELKITEKGLSETRLEIYPPGSLFMVARSGILKRLFPVAINRIPAAANQDMKVLVPFLKGQERYLQIMFRGLADFILTELVKTGTTVQSLKYREFEEQPFPLPPLAEQRRIVARVDELMALCDQLAAARQQRETTRDRLAAASLARLNQPDPDPPTFRAHAAFALDNLAALTTRPDQVKALRQTILNLAVRGKLVPQDASDEPAAELQARLAATYLTHKPKSRQRGTRPVIAAGLVELPPYELPSNWMWTTMGGLGDTNIGLTYAPADVGEEGYPVLRSNNIQGGKIDFSGLVRVRTCPKESAMVQQGDMLICARNGSRALVGKAALIEELPEPMAFGAFMAIFRSPINRYLHLFISSPVFRQVIDEVNTNTINQITQANLRSTLVPLPPLAEQRRIVARVDELMALCDRLEASLSESEHTRRRLLDALLRAALAPAEEPVGA
jgi:type I restriction enzyme S subunit